MQSLSAGLAFTQDLKLGHYMKIPPRNTFTVQIVAALVSSLVQIGVKQWLFKAVPDICSPDQKDLLICPQIAVFYHTSVIW